MRVRLMPLGTVATLAPGERLLDVLDEQGLAVLPTSCRSANCGLCTVIVRGSTADLAPPGPEEQRFLAGLCPGGGQRLGCQLRASPEAAPEAEVTLDILTAR